MITTNTYIRLVSDVIKFRKSVLYKVAYKGEEGRVTAVRPDSVEVHFKNRIKSINNIPLDCIEVVKK